MYVSGVCCFWPVALFAGSAWCPFRFAAYTIGNSSTKCSRKQRLMHCTVFDNLLLSCCPLRYSLRFGSRYHHHYIPDENFIHCHLCFACEVVLEFGADFLMLHLRGVLTHTCTEHCWSAQSLPQSTWIDWLSFQFRPFIVFSISSSVARLSHSVNFICFAAMSVRQPVCGCYCPLIGFADFCALKLSLWDSRRCLTCVTTSVLFISVIRVANVWVCVYLWHSRVHQRQVI